MKRFLGRCYRAGIMVYVLCLLLIYTVIFLPDFTNLTRYRTIGDSMNPSLKAGTTILVKPVEPETIKTGDIIVFKTDDPLLMMHRVIGTKGWKFQTKGDANEFPDSQPVSREKVIGKVVVNFPTPFTPILEFTRALFGQIVLLATLLILATTTHSSSKTTEVVNRKPRTIRM